MNWFKKRNEPLIVDLHSHLIPNIDDGAQSLEQSLHMIERMIALGFKKIITTPHIHPNYPNTAEVILEGFSKLQNAIVKKQNTIELEVAAEYYVDESFVSRVKDGLPILSFGGSFVLVETSFLNKPVYFESTMFDLMSKGYRPILAHPERYRFLEGSIVWLEELKSMGVLLQVTLGSIGGYYGSKPQEMAKTLLKKGMVDFLGSDLHRERHLTYLEKGLSDRMVQRGIKNGSFKNQELL